MFKDISPPLVLKQQSITTQIVTKRQLPPPPQVVNTPAKYYSPPHSPDLIPQLPIVHKQLPAVPKQLPQPPVQQKTLPKVPQVPVDSILPSFSSDLSPKSPDLVFQQSTQYQLPAQITKPTPLQTDLSPESPKLVFKPNIPKQVVKKDELSLNSTATNHLDLSLESPKLKFQPTQLIDQAGSQPPNLPTKTAISNQLTKPVLQSSPDELFITSALDRKSVV